MIMKTLEDIHGYEYDWLACDKSGHVALLSTAGVGYAPSVFLANIDAYDQAIEAILKLPATTSAKVSPKIAEGLLNTWKQVAERGIYGFDADFSGDAYRLVSVPQDPVFVDELPAEIVAVVKQVKLEETLFDLIEGITKSDIVE